MFYSTILFSAIADVNLTPFHPDRILDMDTLNSKPLIIVYLLQDTLHLSKLIPFLNAVRKPFILISAMEDHEFPYELNHHMLVEIVDNPYFKHWFAINKVIPNNSRFTSIPYGLDYWTLINRPYFGEEMQTIQQQIITLDTIAKNTIHFSKRIPKIYANFQLNNTDTRYGGWRAKIPSIIPAEIMYLQPDKIPRSEMYKNMAEYAFVISPFGNGLDCIRTFEALCVGCIVIMQRSCLDIIYEDLPVLVVDEWTDINEQLLQDTLSSFSNKTFNYDKLTMEYWVQQIISKF